MEAAGDVDTLLLDKTGTITFGNRQATEFLPAAGVAMDRMVSAAALSSPAIIVVGDVVRFGRMVAAEPQAKAA